MIDDRIVTLDCQVEDGSDQALRPLKLDDYIGQADICEQLALFMKAAQKRQDPLDHVLISGPPGLGKTTLARIIANEMGSGFRQTSAPIIDKAGDLAALLTNLEANDVLFIDEIHRLNPAIEEILYPAMEDRQIDIMIGEGPAARSIKLDLPPFTLVGATTRAGRLTSPLRDRFGILCRLNFYELSELSAIIARSASLLGFNLSSTGGGEIARRSRGTPRVANRLLRRVRDFAEVHQHDTITEEVADKALSLLDVDKAGLDRLDRQFLSCLVQHFDGGPAGLESIAATIGEGRDTLEEVIEPYLLQQGYVIRTPRGRVVTPGGYACLGLSPAT